MQIFKTERPNIGYYIIKSCINTSLLLLCIFIIAILFSLSLNKELIIIILILGYGLPLLDESRYNRVQEIKFDEVTKEIIFSYKNLYYIPKKKKIPFKEANLDVDLNKGKGSMQQSNIRSLWFSLKGGQEIEVNQTKDGFSTDSLTAICKTALALQFHIRTNKGLPLLL